MWRPILAVVLGYAVMALLVMAFFALVLIDPSYAFYKNGIEVKTSWIVGSLVVSVLAGLAGGIVAFWIAKRKTLTTVVVFAVLALALGVFEAIRQNARPRPEVTPEEVAKMNLEERFKIVVQPKWYAWTLPGLAFASILAGGLVGRRCWPNRSEA